MGETLGNGIGHVKQCWIFFLFFLMQSSVFCVIASLAGKNVHFSVSLLFEYVCQVKSAGFGVVSSMSAADL